jgi:hypothetical protein
MDRQGKLRLPCTHCIHMEKVFGSMCALPSQTSMRTQLSKWVEFGGCRLTKGDLAAEDT